MPTLMIRGLDAETSARVKSYAAARELRVADAAAQLLRIALAHLAARSAGGTARWVGVSDEERSQAGRDRVAARWHRTVTE